MSKRKHQQAVGGKMTVPIAPASLARAISFLLLGALLLAGCASSASTTHPPAATHTAGPIPPVPAGALWPMFAFDASHSGVNPNGGTLTSTNVGQLHRLWQVALPAVADSAPIFLAGVPLPNGSSRDLLFQMTREGRLLALDAGNGSILWSRQPRGPKITHSGPVADPSGRFVYAYGLDGYEHKYAVATGDEVTSGGWPVQVTRMTGTEKESSNPTVAGGRLYVTTSGYIGDAPPYQGHVVTITLADAHSAVFNSLCSDQARLLGPGDCAEEQSGIWARAGVTVDPASGNIFFVTGNGTFDGRHNWGDSVLELDPTGTRLLDSYTPADYQALDDQDADLGSTAPALLPAIPNSRTPDLLVQGGKDGILRVLDRRNLSGQGGPGHVGGEMQTLDAGCGLFTQPVVEGSASSDVWVYTASQCALTAYRAISDASGVTRLEHAWSADVRATTPVLAGGVLYAATSGDLIAFDPHSGRRLWQSDQPSVGGSIGSVHWQSLIVVGGRLYCADEDGHLTAYGL
jgi:outer membrane protein assembly factor BamB